jgi:hypothetical protein
MHGATVGLGPIAAVQSIAVIDGMPTIWGDGTLSIVERSGLLEDMLEEYRSDPEEGLAAICTMRRRRRPTPIQNRFSMAMAEEAPLTRKEGPWQSYPQRMLKKRARSWSIRDGFADVLRGLHIRDEVEDFIEIRGLTPAHRNPARERAPAPVGLSGMPRPVADPRAVGVERGGARGDRTPVWRRGPERGRRAPRRGASRMWAPHRVEAVEPQQEAAAQPAPAAQTADLHLRAGLG